MDQRQRSQADVLRDQVRERFQDREFSERLIAFLCDCQRIIDGEALHFDTRLTVRGGEKYLAIDKHEHSRETGEHIQGCGVYCFIATTDNRSKSVGTVIKGDILKPASYKVPAKHARGNIFDDDPCRNMTWHGPAYMR